VDTSRSSPHLTGEGIARELWLRGLRDRQHVNACVRRDHGLRRQGVLVEHDAFWDVSAEGHAERRPHDHDAELKFRYSMYQSMLRAETHERLDPPKIGYHYLVHRRRYVLETGRWERFVQDPAKRRMVRARVRSMLVSRAVHEGRLQEMTEELTQEVWTRACSSLGSFDPRRSTLEGWMLGVASKTVLLALRRVQRKSFPLIANAEVMFNVSDRCGEGLAERVLRKRSNEEFGRHVLPLLRSRNERLVQKVLDEEPLRGSALRDWKGNLARMQKLCESRGWTSS
jgi:DNA-directed RNA polymerase specialized sigma24 family protein